MISEQFVHLRVHSEFSLIDSVIKVKKLASECARKNIPAVALTDHCNFYGLIKFYKAALSLGIKPLIASDFDLEVDGEVFTFSLIAMNDKGYRNITELISQAYLQGQTLGGDAKIQWQWLEQYSEGVIALSGAKQGEVGKALVKGNKDKAIAALKKWMILF